MSIVAAAMADRQSVGVSPERYSGCLWVFTPHGNDAIATHMGVLFVGMKTLKVFYYCVVRKFFATSRLRMLMQLSSYLFVVNHSILFQKNEQKN